MGNIKYDIKEDLMDISEGLKRFCYDCVYELAIAYNSTLSDGLEYEEGFNTVADMLGVPQQAKEDIELSPINQFIVSIPPYVLYCIENKLKGDSSLKQEASTLVDDGSLYRYLQTIGMSISQEIKGALWKPRLFGLGKLLDAISKLRYRKGRQEGEF